jgi:hypothetical protein
MGPSSNQLSIIVFSTLVVASDLAWRRAKYNEIGRLWVSSEGMTETMDECAD